MSRRSASVVAGRSLARNSLLLLASTVATGLFGFVFWLIAARVFPTADVGRATTLVAATSVIAYLADLGLAGTLVRVLPTSADANRDVNTALVVTGLAAMVVAGVYVALIPVVAPGLRFVVHDGVDIAAFVLLNGAAAANLLTDAVFVAHRRAGGVLLTDGLVQGSTKVVLLLAFNGITAIGIYLASGLGAAVAVAVSGVLLGRQVGFRPSLRVSLPVLRRWVAFSLSVWVANVCQLLPILVLPLIVLDRRGAAAAAEFFVAYNVANLAYAGSFALSTSLLAEGSQAASDVPRLGAQALRILLPTVVVGAVSLGLVAHWLLLAYGTDYSRAATGTLIVLAAALPAVALNNLGQTLLRLAGRVRGLVTVNVMSLVLIVGLAAWGAGRGLAPVAAAWLVGNLAAGLLSVSVWRRMRRRSGGASPIVRRASGRQRLR